MKKVIFLFILALVIGIIILNKKDKDIDLDVTHVVRWPSSQIEVITSKLEIPWELVFLPEGRMLLTERPGRLLLVSEENKNFEIREVAHIGEGGLLGMALDPDFSKNSFLYLYFTYRDGGDLLNKVQRFIFDKDSLTSDKVLLEKIPGSNNHDGGRIKFGPDGKLYITTGDAQKPESAQDVNSVAGKILRINPDGSFPSDNPFPNSPVYSYGHRNPQGLAWDELGNLWATEHGPSLNIWPNCCQDEVNLIQKGKNYGWPKSVGDRVEVGTEAPFLHSGRNIWAPSGAVIKDGKMYFAGLKGKALYQLNLGTKELKEYFKNEYGRLRSVNIGPDGNLYLITSNKDGRNVSPEATDDRLIKVSPGVIGN